MNRQGYHVILNPIIAGTSLMADLLLSRKNEVIVVEVKARTAGNSILNSSVYQLCGYVEAVKRATPTKKVEGWLVTNANFSQAARKAAENVGVRLIPGNELKEMLARIGNHQPYFF
jgi:HJR/Mrr/RecB family endonuclease